MSKLPRDIKPQQLIKLLIKLGFKQGKGKGSHIRFTHPNGKWTQIAVHPKPIPEGTLRKIVKQSELTDENLKELS